MNIITVDDLKTYLAGDTSLTDVELAFKVDLANGVVSDAYTAAVDPPPTWVVALALEVAARACRPTSGGLASLTRTVDDASRTERYSTDASRGGVFLTDQERLQLEGRKRAGTVKGYAPSYLGDSVCQ